MFRSRASKFVVPGADDHRLVREALVPEVHSLPGRTGDVACDCGDVEFG
jgi:hypothetical protein